MKDTPMDNKEGGTARLDIEYIWIDYDFVLGQLDAKALNSIQEVGWNAQQFKEGNHSMRLELCRQLLKGIPNSNEIKLNRWFNVDEYLEARPDLRHADINPTYHYFLVGHKETPLDSYLQTPAERLDSFRIKKDIGKQTFNPEQIAKNWDNCAQAYDLISVKEIVQLLTSHRDNGKAVLFSFSHDDAYVNSGGIQKVVRHETELADSYSTTYVHISPSRPLPFFSDILEKREPGLLRVCVNGVYSGTILEKALSILLISCYEFSFVAVHHLFGFSVENISIAIRMHIRGGKAYYWVHDYSISCTNYTLLKNNRIYCEGPDLQKSLNGCVFCEYLPSRRASLEALSKVTKYGGLQFVFPSEAAHESMKKSFSPVPQKAKQHILPHITIDSISIGEKRIGFDERKCRIAFCGMPVRHKGWEEFSVLATDPLLSASYEWIHIGKTMTELPIDYYYADGISGKRISDLLRELKIDYSFIWPIWPETFCLVAYEAMLAGSHILTHRQAGNVARGLPAELVTCFNSLDDVVTFLHSGSQHINPMKISYCKSARIQTSEYTYSLIHKGFMEEG